MRKLIKSKKDINRERQKSLTLTPTRSDSSEGFLQLPHQDSQDSSSVGSNSLEDGQTMGTKKSSSECLNSLNICDVLYCFKVNPFERFLLAYNFNSWGNSLMNAFLFFFNSI